MVQTVCVLVSTVDRQRLETITTDRNRQRKHMERAQVILASAGGGPVQRIATQVGISRPMVWRWQQRFAEEGVDGLLRDKTRKPGKPRSRPRRSRACMSKSTTSLQSAIYCRDPDPAGPFCQEVDNEPHLTIVFPAMFSDNMQH